MPLLNSLGEKYFCLSAVGNLKQLLRGLIHEFSHLKGKKKTSAKGGGGERAWLIHFTTNISSQPISMYSKTRPRVKFLRKGPFWLDLFLEESSLICSHCHLVDYKGYWFSSNFHFHLAFYGKCTLAVGCRVPHQEDPGLFSNTSLLPVHLWFWWECFFRKHTFHFLT